MNVEKIDHEMYLVIQAYSPSSHRISFHIYDISFNSNLTHS